NNAKFIDEDTGFTDLVMDPVDSKTLYAASYQRRRTSWGFNGGGPGSGVWKTNDAGKTWTRIQGSGFPEGTLGRIGIDVSRSNAENVFVGGLNFSRSTDGGKTFKSLQPGIAHSDHHAIWIDPKNGKHILIGNDGGLDVSYDQGDTWEFVNTIPAAQFYAVAVDM